MVKSVLKRTERIRNEWGNNKKDVEKGKEGKIWTKYTFRINIDNTESTKLVAVAGSQLLSCSCTCRAAGAGGRGQVYTCRFGQLLSCSCMCRAAGAGGRGQVYTCRFGESRRGRGVWRGGRRGAARLEHSLAAASEWRQPTDLFYCELNKDTENRCLFTEPNQNRMICSLFNCLYFCCVVVTFSSWCFPLP